MKYYCITGGIGSGKSYISRLIEQYGFNVYDSDSAAKRLMNGSPEIQSQLKELIGDNAYIGGKLNKPVVAQFLLASDENKQAINAIVHPAVMEDFMQSGLQFMECAIVFEANLQHYFDKVIAVLAPLDVRIQRITERDGITKKKAIEWIYAQYPQEILEHEANILIVNDGIEPAENQVRCVLQLLDLEEPTD